MIFAHYIAAFFYLQPSLLFTYAPTQIILLTCLLMLYKNYLLLQSIGYTIGSQLFSFSGVFAMGVLIVPYINISFCELLPVSSAQIFTLIFLSFLFHFLCIEFFLRYILKRKGLLQFICASNAIAAISVFALYRLLWR